MPSISLYIGNSGVAFPLSLNLVSSIGVVGLFRTVKQSTQDCYSLVLIMTEC